MRHKRLLAYFLLLRSVVQMRMFFTKETYTMRYEPQPSHAWTTNGQQPVTRRWRYTLKDIAVIWMVALILSWLIGLGAVKLIEIVEAILRRLS
jgi:hypothetical protein